MKILATESSGFIGSNLVRLLAEAKGYADIGDAPPGLDIEDGSPNCAKDSPSSISHIRAKGSTSRKRVYPIFGPKALIS